MRVSALSPNSLTLNKELGTGGKAGERLDGRGAEVEDGEPVVSGWNLERDATRLRTSQCRGRGLAVST